MTSSASVDEEVSARDDSVDIDAESTSTITSAMMIAGREESIVGTMRSFNNVPPTIPSL